MMCVCVIHFVVFVVTIIGIIMPTIPFDPPPFLALAVRSTERRVRPTRGRKIASKQQLASYCYSTVSVLDSTRLEWHFVRGGCAA